MKLDWNLMRTILAHVEAETIEAFVADAEAMSHWKEGQLLSDRRDHHTDPAARVVFKHIQLLRAGGFIEGVTVSEGQGGSFQILFSANPSLTLEGYSLLESLRTDGFIERLRAFADEKAVPLTVETVKMLAGALITQILN